MSLNKSNHLQEVLDTHKMSHVNELLEKYREKRKEVKEALEENYKGLQQLFPSN